MPGLDLYAVGDDVELILGALEAGGEFAQIKLDTDGLWRAHSEFSVGTRGRYCFWHISAGPISNPVANDCGEAERKVENPYSGWEHQRITDGQPFFGNGDIGIVWLYLDAKLDGDKIGMTSLGWVGRHFSAIGRVPTIETERRWNKLRRDIDKAGTRMPRGGLSSPSKMTVIGLPHAAALIADGRPAALNPDFTL